MTFPEVDATKRTDIGFRNKVDDDYYLGDSPICALQLDVVYGLPLDYMHLVCLSVVRRLLLSWMKGPLLRRLSSKQVAEISSRLKSMHCEVPSEFSRKPRSLSEIDRYKARGFRQLLLYTGPVVLKGILPDDLYNHFMLSSSAMYCLLSP